MQFLKKPCTVGQVSIQSYFNLHDHKLLCFHLNKARMSVVDQLWNIFVISREKNVLKFAMFVLIMSSNRMLCFFIC